MPQKGQITNKKQYGFFCMDHEQFAVTKWDDESGDVGPFDTFTDAKAALIRALVNRAYDYKQGAKKARSLRKADTDEAEPLQCAHFNKGPGSDGAPYCRDCGEQF